MYTYVNTHIYIYLYVLDFQSNEHVPRETFKILLLCDKKVFFEKKNPSLHETNIVSSLPFG